MGKRLSCVLLFITLLITLTSHNAYAAQQQNDPSFFSFFKNYLIAYTKIDKYNKRVLGAHTKTLTVQQHPSLVQQQITQIPIQGTSLSTVSAYLLNGVNQYRTSLGLSLVQASAETCTFAVTRAQEIASGFNHNGFNNRVASHTIPYSSWSHATENIAEAPNYQEVVTLWKNSPEHAANMRDNTPYVCIEQYGSFYAYEGMRL